MNPQQPVIVYVEDDENSIFVMKMVTEKVMGLQTLHVLPSSADFVKQVKEIGSMPDIILLDIHMKPFDGFELLSMLRGDSQFADSKVIALTASVTNEEVDQLKKSGFNGAIAKPLNLDVFPDLVKRIVNGESVWFIT